MKNKKTCLERFGKKLIKNRLGQRKTNGSEDKYSDGNGQSYRQGKRNHPETKKSKLSKHSMDWRVETEC